MKSLDQIANTVLDSCDSTNTLLRSLGEAGYPQGTWVSARQQTAGRGRLGRKWLSKEGNLFLSFLVRPTNPSNMTWIPLVSAVALYQAIQESFSGNELLGELKIKWPNDVWIGHAKLAGILCEGVGTSRESFVVVGLGLNCVEISAEDQTGLLTPAASLHQFSADQNLCEKIRPRVIAHLTTELEELEKNGFARARKIYEKSALFSTGTSVTWTQTSVQSARVLGLGQSGELKVMDPSGNEQSLWAEDVSLRPSS